VKFFLKQEIEHTKKEFTSKCGVKLELKVINLENVLLVTKTFSVIEEKKAEVKVREVSPPKANVLDRVVFIKKPSDEIHQAVKEPPSFGGSCSCGVKKDQSCQIDES
jgi:hypothetical protein